MDKNRMVLNLAGQEFRISSERDKEYMRELETEVNKRIKAVQLHCPDQSTSRCALLAMLDLADEYAKLKAENEEVDRKISELRSIRDGGEKKPAAPVKRPFERKKPVGV
ncbi:MAG: cell division protein ZapA [Clostridiales bacterium]|nr:cell division protein ZapA [Clostridiales bacterium]